MHGIRLIETVTLPLRQGQFTEAQRSVWARPTRRENGWTQTVMLAPAPFDYNA